MSWVSRTTTKMAELSPGRTATIKAEIKRLEKAREACTDGGIQELIEALIEEHKKKLASANNPLDIDHTAQRPMCSECQKEVKVESRWVDDSGKAIHAECYL